MDFEEQLLEKTLQLDKQLKEVFSVHDKGGLKRDLVNFLRSEFQNGDLKSSHQGLSTSEYKPDDWYESMADNLVNRLIQYFETTKGQTERDV
jgi:hypothetical protein